MKSLRACMLGLGILLAASAAADIITSLPITPRLQWDNKNGYCGECSIQTCALYFGAYISQYQVRAIIDPTQNQDLWIDVHGATALNALRFTYEAWNSSLATPQYPAYLAWAKSHLHNGHPVIITLFVDGEDSADYDHIVPAIGFQSASDWTTYHAGDKLSFYDNYESSAYTRLFSSLYDTRAMSVNGANYEYCIPQAVDYGTAITGYRDDDKVTVPVRLNVGRWDEPNVTLGESAVTLNATLTIESLKAGTVYTLYRYDDYHKVPVKNFPLSAYTSAVTFTATAATKTLSDHFMSNGMVFYRCVPHPASNAADPAWNRYR